MMKLTAGTACARRGGQGRKISPARLDGRAWLCFVHMGTQRQDVGRAGGARRMSREKNLPCSMKGRSDIMKVNSYIDHTYLKAFATEKDIEERCEEAIVCGFASVCVNPCNVKTAARKLAGSKVHVCSVAGFPLGTHTTEAKMFEAKQAMDDGADEIDMVINIGKLIEGDEAYVEGEVAALVRACHDRQKLLKVIVETCYLNEDQIAAMCRIVERTGADYIKTSTGFGTRGASEEDVLLFKKYLKIPAKIKASGGIRTLADAERYIELGCLRIGTSNGVEIAKQGNGRSDQ